MRAFFIAIMLAAATLAAGCSATQSGAAMIARGDVIENSRRIVEAYAASWNAGDMNRFGALYAADARHVNTSGEFLRGRSAIVAAHRVNRERYAAGVRMATRLEGARAITDDAIVAVMLMEIVNDPTRPGEVQTTRMTLTLARRDGDWLIAQAQASAVS